MNIDFNLEDLIPLGTPVRLIVTTDFCEVDNTIISDIDEYVVATSSFSTCTHHYVTSLAPAEFVFFTDDSGDFWYPKSDIRNIQAVNICKGPKLIIDIYQRLL